MMSTMMTVVAVSVVMLVVAVGAVMMMAKMVAPAGRSLRDVSTEQKRKRKQGNQITQPEYPQRSVVQSNH